MVKAVMVVIHFADGGKGGLRLAVRLGQAETPALNGGIENLPLVRPGIHRRPAQTLLEYRTQLPVQEFSLAGFAMPAAVQADFGEQQGPITRLRLQPVQVRAELSLPFQIDVVRNNIQEWQVKILGGRMVD